MQGVWMLVVRQGSLSVHLGQHFMAGHLLMDDVGQDYAVSL